MTTQVERVASTSQVITPQWEMYYDAPVRSYRSQALLFQNAIYESAIAEPSILTTDTPITFVLGGLHPFNGTPRSFKDFCTTIHPHAEDKHIYIDMNRLPLNVVDRRLSEYKIQAMVEKLPLKGIDFLILDGTVDFMQDEQLQQLSHSAMQTLAKNGLLLMTKTKKEWLEALQDEYPDLSLFPRTCATLLKLMPDVNLVSFSIGQGVNLLGVARKDSAFKTIYPAEEELRDSYVSAAFLK